MPVRTETSMTADAPQRSQPAGEPAHDARARHGDNTPQPIRSLRDWLDHLAARDRLTVVKPGIGLRFELAAIAKRLDGLRATLFPRPGGHPIPVVSGLVSDRGWMAEAMGVEPREVLARFQEAALNPLPVAGDRVGAGAGGGHPRGRSRARCCRFPSTTSTTAAPMSRAGLMITRNPRTGKQNVSIHRCQLSGPNRLGVLLLPRHTHMFFEMAEQGGKPLEAAIVVGIDPLTLLASQAIAPIDVDELEIAGALHRRPLPVVKCLTSELRVPAEAEIVIEGRLLPGRARAGGAVRRVPAILRRARRPPRDGDRRGHAPQGRDLPHHRRRRPGALCCWAPSRARRPCWRICSGAFPNVRDVHLARGGVCRYHLYVQIRKRQEGEAKNIMLGAFAGHYDVKHVIVVDEDVDIHDSDEVEWAVATRFQADRDLS